MATFNWPGFGISAISWTFDQPSQANTSDWTGTATVVSVPWHGSRSATVTLATMQGDANFLAIRAFFSKLQGQINTFHLPAVEEPQNSNSGVSVATSAAQSATSLNLTGLMTALVAGNMITVNGQLLQLTSVGSLSGSAQTVNFVPSLTSAASVGTEAQTAKPYLLCRLSGSSIKWDIASWRRYGMSFDVTEAIAETDGASPDGDLWGGTGGATAGQPIGGLLLTLTKAA